MPIDSEWGKKAVCHTIEYYPASEQKGIPTHGKTIQKRENECDSTYSGSPE